MSVRATLRQRFEVYRPEVEAIAGQIKDLGDAWRFEDLNGIRGYIGSGTETNVFRLQSEPSLVAKLGYASEEVGGSPKEFTQEKVDALICGMGQSSLEQIVAFNNSRRRKLFAMICRFVGGPSLRSCRDEERHAFQRDEYGGLITTFQSMQARGLLFRTVSRDIIHEPGEFTVIDYKRSQYQTLEDKVVDFSGESMLLEKVRYRGEVPAYGLLYRDVCEEILGGNMAAAIEAGWRRQKFTIPA